MSVMSPFPKGPFNTAELSVLDFAGGTAINAFDGNVALDAYPAFLAAKEQSRANGSGVVNIPRGRYYLSRGIEQDCCIQWRGAGGGGVSEGGTQIYFPGSCHGIVAQSAHTSSSGGSAAGSSFSNIFFGALAATAGTYRHGIVIRSPCKLDNVSFGYLFGPYDYGFSGNGVHLVTASDGNVTESRRWLKAGDTYVVGDIGRGAPTDIGLCTSATGTLSLTVVGGTNIEGYVTIARSISWNTIPASYAMVVIAAGSALAGPGGVNVGMYYADPNTESPTSTTVKCRKISDSPYYVTNFFTQPATVASTSYSANAVRAYNEGPVIYCCTSAGVATVVPSVASGVTFVDGGTLGVPGPTWKGTVSLGLANDFKMSSVRCDSNRGNGIYIEGADVNTVGIFDLSASNNGGWGDWDNSFLGCQHLVAHTSANVKGPYRMASHGNARTGFQQCYSESGQSLGSLIYAPGEVSGGIHAAGFHPESNGWWKQNGSDFQPFSVAVTSASKTLTHTMGAGLAGTFDLYAQRVTHTDDPSGILLWKYDATRKAYGAYKTNQASPSFELGAGDFPTTTFLNAPRVRVGTGAAGVPPVTAGVGVTSTNGYPLLVAGATNCFYVGDLILNYNCGVDGIKGWVCIGRCGSGPLWQANQQHEEGSTVTPSAGTNGRVYRRHSTSAGIHNGNTQPAWTTTLGALFTDGDIIWECFGSTTTGLSALA